MTSSMCVVSLHFQKPHFSTHIVFPVWFFLVFFTTFQYSKVKYFWANIKHLRLQRARRTKGQHGELWNEFRFTRKHVYGSTWNNTAQSLLTHSYHLLCSETPKSICTHHPLEQLAHKCFKIIFQSLQSNKCATLHLKCVATPHSLCRAHIM